MTQQLELVVLQLELVELGDPHRAGAVLRYVAPGSFLK